MNIIIGVSGGIAAYKTCELVRLLIKQGHTIKVIMTEHAKQFIHPNTFAALSNNPVHSDLFDTDDIMLHITLAKWADKIIIAPASANTISKLAQGQADNLLGSTCLAASAPIYIAAAMNKVMWSNQLTQSNITKLEDTNIKLIPPAEGEQACGDIGPGRMAEPEDIIKHITTNQNPLAGYNILITAGPTQEKIDPVRYLSNFSSGKMGYALATACQQLGANVTLVSGPTHLDQPQGCNRLSVNSAHEMYNAVISNAEKTNIIIAAAAVADYTPTHCSSQKIKKNNQTLTLELEKTTDIIAHVSKRYPHIFTVGFCAETQNILQFAKEKRQRKNLDIILANKISASGYPFNADSNSLLLISKDEVIDLGHDSKSNLAKNIINLMITKNMLCRIKKEIAQ